MRRNVNMKRKFGWLLMSVVVCSLLLMGCSKDKDGDSSAAEGSSGGETLIYGRGADTMTLDAHNTLEVESSRVSMNIYETLVLYDQETEQIEPLLATTWETSEDDKTWTFTLQENVKFHDGTDFNADAVVYNFERMKDPEHPEHHGGFTNYLNKFGNLIDEVTAIDTHTVSFKLNEVSSTFLPNLGTLPFGIISPEALKEHGEAIAENPIGTGPFKYESWSKNESLTLVKNDDYWVPDLPKLGKIVFKVIPDNSARLTALKNGELDFIDGINPSDIESIKSNDKLTFHSRPAGNVGFVSINTHKPPFDNLKVRQAVNYAIDKHGIADAFYGGQAEVATGMLPSAIWGFNKELEGYEYDPEKAKQLLKEAGFEDGFEVEYWTTTSPRIYLPQPLKIAEVIKENLEAVGIAVKIESFEWATYVPKIMNAEHSLAVIGWNNENADPDNILYTLLSSNNAVPPNASNFSLYQNDKVDQLLKNGSEALSREQREKDYIEAQGLVHDDAPTIPLVYVEGMVVTGSNVSGYNPTMMGYESLQGVSIRN